MAVARTKIARLSAPEAAEIERVLAARDPDSFVSDEGDAMAFPLLVFLCAVGGIAAYFFVFGLEEIRGALAFLDEAPEVALRALFLSPPNLGLLVAIAAAAFLAVRFLSVHERHGWMVTSFGVVRIRGRNLKLLRYEDVARAERRRVHAGRRRHFSVLTLTARNGSQMTTYATRLMDTIEARIPPPS